MALFIHPENQNILWEMLNRIPLCNSVFPEGQKNEKNNWFKSTIQEYYNRLPQNITRNDLYQINREVLSTMIKKLGQLSIQSSQNSIDRGVFSRLDKPVETKKSTYEERQSQYNSMFENKKPDPIDFSEKFDDDVITNMNELIENQRKMRELELQQFAPKPIESLQNSKVNILEDVPKEVIQSQVLLQEKHVRFDLSEDKKQITQSYDFKDLEKKIENMDKRITQIFELLTLSHKNNTDNQDYII